MINVSLKNNPQAELQSLIDAFSFFPRHIAKKHLQAVMKRTTAGGVPILKAVTPKRKTKVVFGRNKASGEYTATKVKGGALRRSVTSKAKYVGRSGAGNVYGVVGYKAGPESRKAIWLQEGTKTINPRAIMEQFHSRYSGPALSKLTAEMAAALEKAAKELAAGKNPTRTF
jgi:hypothetical protein